MDQSAHHHASPLAVHDPEEPCAPAAIAAEPLPAEPPLPPAARLLRLTELGDGHCRWPVGDPLEEDFRFCAADRQCQRGTAYCPFHARIALAPETDLGVLLLCEEVFALDAGLP